MNFAISLITLFYRTSPVAASYYKEGKFIILIIDFGYKHVILYSDIYNISDKLLRPSQFLENVLEILEGSTLQKYTQCPRLNVAAYWQSSNTAKRVPRNCLRYLETTLIMGEGIGLRIYVKYCRSRKVS